LSASFLGAAAISRGAPAWAVVLAMAAFLSTGAFAGWVLWPARVSFVVDADRVEKELFPYREDPAATSCGPGMACATYPARIEKSSSDGS
jgi:hypothetical protein